MEFPSAVRFAPILLWLQDKPILVDVGKQPTPTRDITFDFLIGMFTMAGLFLLAALVGSVMVAVGIILYKRRHASTESSDPGHTTLRI
jgi:hypothetical protein